MSSPVFVTGATGVLGFNLIRALLDQGASVRVILRNNEKYNNMLKNLPLDRHYGDTTNINALRQAIKGCEELYHCEERDPFGYCSPDAYREVNVQGTNNVLQAAWERGIPRIVYASSAYAVGSGSEEHPAEETSPYNLEYLNDPYVESRREAESLIQEYLQKGLEIVTLNPGLLVGPGNIKPNLGRTLLQFSSFMTRFTPGGGALVSDAEDVARLSLFAMKDGVPGERYIVGSEYVRYDALMEVADSVLGVHPICVPVPRSLALLGAMLGDAYARARGVPLTFFPSVSIVKRMYMDLVCSPKKATLKWGVSWTPLRGTVEKSLQWLRENRMM